MKRSGICLTLAVLVGASAAAAATEVRQITVLQRVWDITQVSSAPLTYKDVRQPMPNEFFFFGPPAELKTVQAIRAVEGATGCQVVRSSMYQNISAEFFTQVVCPASSLPAQ